MIIVELKNGRKLNFVCECDGAEWDNHIYQKLIEEFAVLDKQMENYSCERCGMYPWYEVADERD